VTTIAGVPGVSGYLDGDGSIAKFNRPQGIAIDALGTLYVSDTENNSIRIITPDFKVSTLISPDSGDLNFPTGIDVDISGNVYVADTSNNLVRIIAKSDGIMSTLVGFKDTGYVNGMNNVVRFHYPTGIKIHRDGSLLVTDQYNSVVRKIYLGENEQLIIDNGVVTKRPESISFNYADIALTPVYSQNKSTTVPSQNLNLSRSSGVAGQLGPTLSRNPGSFPPSIQGYQRGNRR
jgi:hypothetical protein